MIFLCVLSGRHWEASLSPYSGLYNSGHRDSRMGQQFVNLATPILILPVPWVLTRLFCVVGDRRMCGAVVWRRFFFSGRGYRSVP